MRLRTERLRSDLVMYLKGLSRSLSAEKLESTNQKASSDSTKDRKRNATGRPARSRVAFQLNNHFQRKVDRSQEESPDHGSNTGLSNFLSRNMSTIRCLHRFGAPSK